MSSDIGSPPRRSRRAPVVIAVIAAIIVSAVVVGTARTPSYGATSLPLTSAFLDFPEDFGKQMKQRGIADVRASTVCFLGCTMTTEVLFGDGTTRFTFKTPVDKQYPRFAVESAAKFSSEANATQPYRVRTTADRREYSVDWAANIAAGIVHEALKHVDKFRERDANAASWELPPPIPAPRLTSQSATP